MQCCVIIPRLENLTLLILNYNIFQLVTSWFDTILSRLIHTLNDGLGEFWTSACYLLAQIKLHYLNILCSSHDTDIRYACSRGIPHKPERMIKKRELLEPPSKWLNGQVINWSSLLQPTFQKDKALSKDNEVSNISLRWNNFHPRNSWFIQWYIRNFTSFGNFNKNKPTWRPVTVTTQTNIDKATQIIRDNNSVSLKHLFQQMGFSYTQLVVKQKLKFRPYKFQVCQQLQHANFARNTQFYEWFLQKLEDQHLIGGLIFDQHLIGGLIFSDEAHFSLSGYVNRQNLRFWAGNNTMEIMKVPLHC